MEGMNFLSGKIKQISVQRNSWKNKMRKHVIMYVGFFFPFLYSPVLSNTFPNVVCFPAEKVINVAEDSKIVLECSIKISNDETAKFEWSTTDDQAIEKMTISEHIINVGELKNITSISTIYSKNKSPTFLTEASLF